MNLSFHHDDYSFRYCHIVWVRKPFNVYLFVCWLFLLHSQQYFSHECDGTEIFKH